MGFPKALLTLGGDTFLDRLIARLSPACSPVVVVLGAEAPRIQASLQRPAVIAVNHHWREGMLTSLQAGLGAVPPGCRGVLFTLVDHPNVRAETIAALAAAGPTVRIPRFQGRRGHPVYFPSELIPEFLAERESPRNVIRRHPAVYLDLDDPAIVEDIDDPETYRRVVGL